MPNNIAKDAPMRRGKQLQNMVCSQLGPSSRKRETMVIDDLKTSLVKG
jgi:hypothetical protein